MPYAGRPTNAVSARKYSGVNVTILWASAAVQGFEIDRWLTFRQAQTAGGKIRRGEKGTAAILFRYINVPGKHGDPDSSSELAHNNIKRIKMIRGFTLFNVQQCIGLPEEIVKGKPEPTLLKSAWERHQQADRLITTHSVRLRFGKKDAYYSAEKDTIFMPSKTAFESTSGYYTTLLHELTHWTGHRNRLNRPGITHASAIDVNRYAYEEMIAEIGSAFLCAEFGIPGHHQHEAYVLSWIKKLENDPRAIFDSSSEAWKARCYLMGESAYGDQYCQTSCH